MTYSMISQWFLNIHNDVIYYDTQSQWEVIVIISVEDIVLFCVLNSAFALNIDVKCTLCVIQVLCSSLVWSKLGFGGESSV